MVRLQRLITVLVLLITCSMLTGCNEDMLGEQIEEAVKSVYSPESMEEFVGSYNENKGTLFTEECADNFYVCDEDKTLSERDLSRTVVIDIGKSEPRNNTRNQLLYLAQIRIFAAGLNEPIKADITFYINDKKQIEEFKVDVLNNPLNSMNIN